MTSQPRAEEIISPMLSRSHALNDAIWREIKAATIEHSLRSETVFTMCSLSLEHGQGVRVLIANGCLTSVIGLMRMQFEAVVRAMWLLYAAGEPALAKISAALTQANEQKAKNLPSVSEMIEQMRGRAGNSMPSAAFEMLEHFKLTGWSALNSFVHGGIHPLRRYADGYPVQLLMDVLRNSNGLCTMSGMTMAVLTGDRNVCRRVGSLQQEFEDCLPPLQSRRPSDSVT